ncbi:MAG: RagB/SusD family nutrient uptake outer membrane protein [Tannerellaceae bacterium]|nr:RagB/SusD family nutrient uptake outer membrane protein [Tannerellaceae bacterium]
MKKISIIFLFTYLFYSCTDLDISPNSQLTDDTAYKSKEEFLYGLSNVYATLGVWSEITHKAGASTDELIFPARGADWKGHLQPLQDHSWDSDNDELNSLYNGVSQVIAVSNSFIDAIEKSDFSTDKDILVIKAETRFVRAFAYFLMMDMWGNVPLVTSPEYDPKNLPKQKSRKDIFEFVEDELKEIIEDGLADAVEYGRVDSYAGKTLLAKLYLNAEVYLGEGNAKWNEVVSLTKDIIENSNYILEDNFKDVFKWDNFNSKEILFAMVCDSRGTRAENISYLFTLNDMSLKYGDFAKGWNGCSTLPTFYRSFDATDVRREIFLEGPQVDVNGDPIIQTDDQGNTRQLEFSIDYYDRTPGANSTYDPVYNADHWDGVRVVKYLMDGIGGSMEERTLNNGLPILRYADVLLMRAEALFRLDNNSTEALTLVNQVRTRNGYNPVTPFAVLTEENLLAERGREFTWEGWRRNDQIRFGVWEQPWDYKPQSSPVYRLFPIPQRQMDSNPNLKQHTGY